MNAEDTSQPGPDTLEKRANQRLAVDLSRFHRALDQIEQHRVDCAPIAASPSTAPMPTAPYTKDSDVREYLACLDQCYQQLDESKAAIDAILLTPRPRLRRV